MTILVDITRTVSRAGAGAPTGVDRVEHAYIRYALSQKDEVFFLSRALATFVLLDRAGMEAFLKHVDGHMPLDAPDIFSQLGRRQSRGLRRSESTLRRLSIGSTRRARLSQLLKKHLKPGFLYINVGHTNLALRVLANIRQAGAACIAIMVHDIIPLEYPEYARPGSVERFATLFRTAAQNADLMIYNSADTQARSERWLAKENIEVPGIAAPLGVDPLPFENLVKTLEPAPHPGFVMLGTIEPRKNHLILLSIWREFYETLPPERTPHLHIIGRRGWENENIVDILDRAPFMRRTVFEHGFLNDQDMATYLGQSCGLLFPSFAEGFGYPLVEALQIDKPVICSDLPAFREVGGDLPIYLNPLDGPGWKDHIMSLAWPEKDSKKVTTKPYHPPRWNKHFRVVFAAIETGQQFRNQAEQSEQNGKSGDR